MFRFLHGGFHVAELDRFRHRGPLPQFVEQIAEQLLFHEVGQPLGPLLRKAGLQAAEEACGGLASALAGGADHGLGDARGDGRVGGDVPGHVARGVHGRLAHEIAGQHPAADAERDGDRGPGDRHGLVERLQPARDPRIAGLPGVQLRAKHGAIVFIDRRKRSMGRLDAGKKLGAGLAAQDPLQARLQDLVADLREPRKLVEEFFDRHDHGRLLLPLKGRQADLRWDRPPRSRPRGPAA